MSIQKEPNCHDKSSLRVSGHRQRGPRSYQEDEFRVFHISPTATVFLLCDGHGGFHAARFVCNQVRRKMKKVRTPEDLWRVIRNVIRKWQKHCFQALGISSYPRSEDERKQLFAKLDSLEEYENKGMDSGCTMLAGYLDLAAKVLHIMNIGDSQAAWVVDEDRVGFTVPHEPNGYDLGPSGGTIRRDGYSKRINGDLAVGRAVGDHSLSLLGSVRDAADFYDIPFVHSIQGVFGSDGIWDVLKPDDALRHQKAEEVVNAALAADSQDNVTAICFTNTKK